MIIIPVYLTASYTSDGKDRMSEIAELEKISGVLIISCILSLRHFFISTVTMNKYLYTCIIILALCSDFEFACKIVCAHDGDERGTVIDGSCYCANKRDITNIITRVPRYGKQVKVKYESNYSPGEM